MTDKDRRSSPPEFFSRQVRRARRFYLDLAPPVDTSLAVVCGGVEECAPEYAINRSTFSYYSIEFVARGRGTLELAGKETSLLPGTVFAYGPGISQRITTNQSDPLVKYFVDFTGSEAPELLETHGVVPGNVLRVAAVSEVQQVFDDLIRDGLRSTGRTAALCEALLPYLIVKVADAHVPGNAQQTQALGTYQTCRRHIVDHCDRLMSLAQIAHECHVDRAYLCRLFRRFDHQTPHQFLMRLKMNLAAERLQDPSVLVKQVSAQLGFADPFHFSRAFKRVFGISPDTFRRLR